MEEIRSPEAEIKTSILRSHLKKNKKLPSDEEVVPYDQEMTITGTSTLHEFNATSDLWPSYKTKVNFYFVANAVKDEAIKKAIFLSNCSLQTLELLQSMVMPEKLDDDAVTYAKLVEELDKKFKVARTSSRPSMSSTMPSRSLVNPLPIS